VAVTAATNDHVGAVNDAVRWLAGSVNPPARLGGEHSAASRRCARAVAALSMAEGCELVLVQLGVCRPGGGE
jgi:hypothetical protein